MTLRELLNKHRWHHHDIEDLVFTVVHRGAPDDVRRFRGDEIRDIGKNGVLLFGDDEEDVFIPYSRFLQVVGTDRALWVGTTSQVRGTVRFICAQCRLFLTPALPELEAATSLNDGEPLVQAGWWRAAPPLDFENGYVVAPADATGRFAEGSSGCCGPEGPWQCLCGAHVGQAFEDCWGPHFVAFDPANVRGVIP
jgi:uncharacterized protein (UPF0248 family)